MQRKTVNQAGWAWRTTWETLTFLSPWGILRLVSSWTDDSRLYTGTHSFGLFYKTPRRTTITVDSGCMYAYMVHELQESDWSSGTFELLYFVCISSFVFISLRRGYGSPLKKWINPDMCQFNLLLTIWFEEISCIFNLQLNKFHFPPLMDPLNYVLRLINLFWIKNV